ELGRQERAQRLAQEVDWEVIPRNGKNTPREDPHRGGHEDTHRGAVSGLTPKNTQKKKTQLEEDTSIISNSFESQTQKFNKKQTSKFSKKRDNFDKNGALEAEPPEPQRRSQSRGLTPIADA